MIKTGPKTEQKTTKFGPKTEQKTTKFGPKIEQKMIKLGPKTEQKMTNLGLKPNKFHIQPRHFSESCFLEIFNISLKIGKGTPIGNL
jgi:hypothetical protein